MNTHALVGFAEERAEPIYRGLAARWEREGRTVPGQADPLWQALVAGRGRHAVRPHLPGRFVPTTPAPVAVAVTRPRQALPAPL